MKIGSTTVSAVAGFLLLLLSLAYNYQYPWNTVNSQGPLTYQMKAYGLPLQYIYQEVSSPVGPSSFFKISLGNLLLDFVVWGLLAYVLLALVRRRRPVQTVR